VDDATAFREQFPVFERVAYLNAGTEGPIPARAVAAARARIELELTDGRSGHPYIEALMDLAARLRARYADVLGCDVEEVALTGSTTDGVNTVLSGLDLRPDDEILTTDEEHPGLLAPLGRARLAREVTVKVVPFAEIASEASAATRLIACSHVSYVSGQVVDTSALARTGVPVLLDGAQALGAIPVDVRTLGCDFYAASGQKWLCGPEGSGSLFVREDRVGELLIPWPGFGSLADHERALELEPAAGAARFDHGFPTGIRSEWALASLDTLEEAGWEWIHPRATTLAASLASELAARGADVRERGPSTLVSWRVAEPEADVERLAAAGIVVRSIPALGVVRASVGAWSSEEELERLVEAAL
jgi:L-cysteine/cystine lyase